MEERGNEAEKVPPMASLLADLTPGPRKGFVPPMLLVIDNFDSFTYNLVQYFGELGVSQEIYRNDEIGAAEVIAKRPDRIMLSPGPCSPREAGCSLAVVGAAAEAGIPLLGVCLGHQSVGQHFGGRIVRAERLMHGKTSPIRHHGRDLFAGLPSPFAATRYHSLLVERESFPACLEVTAETSEGEIMGLRHRELPIWGVQFHPESLATEHGRQLLENFLRLP
jgi:anthranilate synthase/aminodeoxychorismate synthase-like glutamine amidotransferase